MAKIIFDDPGTIAADDGVVTVKGPGELELQMTPRVAEELSERLLEAAMQARGQRYFEDRR